MSPDTDRALQDTFIRLLADAPFRYALTNVDQGSAYGGMTPQQVDGIRSGDARRVDRFARFLARQYYGNRIFTFHKYSRALARFTGRSPEGVVRTPEFDNLIPTIILGSRSTARDVSRLVQAYLADARGAPPYAAELARYENAQLLAESGPRVPPVNPSRARAHVAVVVNPEAAVHRFTWNLPGIFQPLLDLGETEDVPAHPPEAERAELSLVFVRSPRGRVTVLRWTENVENLTTFMDGERPLSDAIDAAGIPPRDGLEMATALLDAGVLIPV